MTTIRRAELGDGATSMTAANDLAVRRALELVGVEFIDENDGGPGVRLGKRQPEPMVDARRHKSVDSATDRALVVTCSKMTQFGSPSERTQRQHATA